MDFSDCNPDEPLTVHYQKEAESSNRFTQRRASMMLTLIEEIREHPAKLSLCGAVIAGQLWLFSQHNSTIEIWIDAPDYAPMTDDFPPYYYRIEAGFTSIRTSSVQEAIGGIIDLLS